LPPPLGVLNVLVYVVVGRYIKVELVVSRVVDSSCDWIFFFLDAFFAWRAAFFPFFRLAAFFASRFARFFADFRVNLFDF
jgi:hypothetical protein